MKTPNQTQATARPWRVRQHSADENEFHISAPTPEGHPYHGRTNEIQVMSDEDYPTKRADAELIVAAVNEREALLAIVKSAQKCEVALQQQLIGSEKLNPADIKERLEWALNSTREALAALAKIREGK